MIKIRGFIAKVQAGGTGNIRKINQRKKITEIQRETLKQLTIKCQCVFSEISHFLAG